MAKEPKSKAQANHEMIWSGAAVAPRTEANPPPARPAQTPTAAAPASKKTAPKSSPSRALAQTVIQSFIHRLNELTRQRGGYLTGKEVTELGREFEAKTDALEKLFHQSMEEYVRARERAAFDHARQYPFDRVLVNNFAHLFDPERVTSDGPNGVMRKVLPGFFLAVDKMLGPELMEQFQTRCRAIVERVSPGQENTLDWEVVYALPETKELSAEALAAMAPYFEDVDKRRDWLLPLVNDNLTAEDAWELTPGGFSNLIAACLRFCGAASPTTMNARSSRHGSGSSPATTSTGYCR